MNRTEINGILEDRESRDALESKLRDEGFEDCLRFLKLIESLNSHTRKLELDGWRSIVYNYPEGRKIFEIAKRGIINLYEENYQEAARLADQHKRIEFVRRISKYLTSEYEEFMSQF